MSAKFWKVFKFVNLTNIFPGRDWRWCDLMDSINNTNFLSININHIYYQYWIFLTDREISAISLQMPFCYASYLATSLVAIYHQPARRFFSSLITLSSSITLPCHWGDGKKWRQDGGAGIDDWSYNRHMGWLQPQKLMMDQCCQLQKTANSRRKYNLKLMKGKRVWF